MDKGLVRCLLACFVCLAAAGADAATRVGVPLELRRTAFFQSDESDRMVEIEAGDYRVHREGLALRVKPMDGGKGSLISARVGRHDKFIVGNVSFSFAGREDSTHLEFLTLLMPGGDMLTAIGSQSGVATRDIFGDIGGAFEDLGGYVVDGANIVGGGIVDAANWAGQAFEDAWNYTRNNFVNRLGEAFSRLGDVWNGLTACVGEFDLSACAQLSLDMALMWGNAFLALAPVAAVLYDLAMEYLDELVCMALISIAEGAEWIEKVVGPAADVVEALLKPVTDAVAKVTASLIDPTDIIAPLEEKLMAEFETVMAPVVGVMLEVAEIHEAALAVNDQLFTPSVCSMSIGSINRRVQSHLAPERVPELACPCGSADEIATELRSYVQDTTCRDSAGGGLSIGYRRLHFAIARSPEVDSCSFMTSSGARGRDGLTSAQLGACEDELRTAAKQLEVECPTAFHPAELVNLGGAIATQSSDYPANPSGGALRAVDGRTVGAYFQGSVSHTKGQRDGDPHPWWQLRIPEPTAIGSVLLHNRTDCCAERLDGASVFLSEFELTEKPYATPPAFVDGFRSTSHADPGNWGSPAFTWVGDFNGDGKDDLASADGTKLHMKISTGSHPVPVSFPTNDSWGDPDLTFVGDFNGDGMDDIASTAGGNAYMRLGRGTGAIAQTWALGEGWGGHPAWTWVGDFDGDGKHDIASAQAAHTFMKLSRGTRFDTADWSNGGSWGGSGYAWVGDFDGDGKHDIASVDGKNTFMKLSRGDRFENVTWPNNGSWGPARYTRVGDFDGDGKDDIASLNGAVVRVKLSTGSGFREQNWPVDDFVTSDATLPGSYGGPESLRVADFDGDGKDDIASAMGKWTYVKLSTGSGFRNLRWENGPHWIDETPAPTEPATLFCPTTAGVQAGGHHLQATPDLAFDCQEDTGWNAGGYQGSLKATFATPQTFSGIQITAAAQPTANETYTIKASDDGTTWRTLATKTLRIEAGGPKTQPLVAFPPTTAKHLAIEVNGGASWVAIMEVRVQRPKPGPPTQVTTRALDAGFAAMMKSLAELSAAAQNLAHDGTREAITPSAAYLFAGDFDGDGRHDLLSGRGKQLLVNKSTRSKVFSHQLGKAKALSVVAANGFIGQFVLVQSGTKDWLSLAEVQVVTPTRINLATAIASQSSQLAPGLAGASIAIDGNTEGRWETRSVTHTRPDEIPWWQVELAEPLAIGGAVLHNRTDCCGERLDGYKLYVSEEPFPDGPLSGDDYDFVFEGGTAGTRNVVDVGGVVGRYVRVQARARQPLSLAEVELYAPVVATRGEPEPPPDLESQLAGATSGPRPSWGRVLGVRTRGEGDAADRSWTEQTVEHEVLAPGATLAQTFTVGDTGVLRSVRLRVTQQIWGDADLVLEVRRVDADGRPSLEPSDTLFRGRLPRLRFPLHGSEELTEVDVSSASIEVAPGDRLALTIESEGTAGYDWWSREGYARGEAWVIEDDLLGDDAWKRTGSDFVFATDVGEGLPGVTTSAAADVVTRGIWRKLVSGMGLGVFWNFGKLFKALRAGPFSVGGDVGLWFTGVSTETPGSVGEAASLGFIDIDAMYLPLRLTARLDRTQVADGGAGSYAVSGPLNQSAEREGRTALLAITTQYPYFPGDTQPSDSAFTVVGVDLDVEALLVDWLEKWQKAGKVKKYSAKAVDKLIATTWTLELWCRPDRWASASGWWDACPGLVVKTKNSKLTPKKRFADIFQGTQLEDSKRRRRPWVTGYMGVGYGIKLKD